LNRIVIRAAKLAQKPGLYAYGQDISLGKVVTPKKQRFAFELGECV
jgi:hypothetical protein